MTLSKKQAKKQSIISTYKIGPTDTGSEAVQAAIFTERINELTAHLAKNPKDKNSRTGLMALVGKRRARLNYIQKTQGTEAYSSLIARLGIRK